MRVLVTGGTGFLGSHICARLLEEGHELTVLRRATSNLSDLEGRAVRYVVGDITDAESVAEAVGSQEIVIHAAALVGYASAKAHEAVNEGGTRNVVTACRRLGVGRLVHISSVAAVGIPEHRHRPADDAFVFNLEGSALGYHISKRRAEQVVTRAVAEGLDAVIVNARVEIGAGHRTSGVEWCCRGAKRLSKDGPRRSSADNARVHIPCGSNPQSSSPSHFVRSGR